MRQMEKEHEKLLKLLRDQDEAKLDDLIRVHVEGAKLDLISRMEAAMPAATGTG